jgi:hypothetical protein
MRGIVVSTAEYLRVYCDMLNSYSFGTLDVTMPVSCKGPKGEEALAFRGAQSRFQISISIVSEQIQVIQKEKNNS